MFIQASLPIFLNEIFSLLSILLFEIHLISEEKHFKRVLLKQKFIVRICSSVAIFTF